MASAALGTAFQHLRDLFGAGTATGLADGQLLARFSSENDAVAFEALVARYGPMVLANCRAVLKNEQDVEDAFQTTFLVLARKAHSIRGGEVLGGWLHRVAYRAAVQVSVEAKKRRRKEAEASAMAPLSASRSDHESGSDFDLRAILLAEIDRLPERQRLPVVLCDLEGLTYDQAADRLRWTVPTLRCRLARARQRLKGRLTQRGFVAPALGAMLPGEGARAAVPPLLIRSTVLAATGGPAAAGVLLMTHAILRGMFMTKLKFATTAALAALALASAGVIAAGGPRADDAKPAMKSPQYAGAALEKPAPNTPVEMVEIKGRVVAPDGRPVAGALVTTLYMDTDIFTNDTSSIPWPKTSSGSDGRFAIRLPQTKLDPSIAGYMSTEPWLVASSPGFGFGWCQRGLITKRPAEQVITLAEEGPPIEGRIVDLEGRPVVGASVRAAWIWYEEKGNLAGWIAKARNGAAGNLWQGLQRLTTESLDRKLGHAPRERLIPIATTTAADGRFKLTGVGRDRIAELMVSGTGIATTQAYVFSRPEREIRDVDKGMMQRQPFIVHAPTTPSSPWSPGIRVQGSIRDSDSGRPIAGLEIQAAVFDEHSRVADPGIEALTDSDGKYRLDGLSKAAAYQLFIKTAKGLPYTNTTRKVPAQSAGLEPITFDIAMKRGVFVRGKAIDKATGGPIKGTVNYYAFADNAHVREFAGFSVSRVPYAPLDEQGRFEVVALPGRGVIAVRDEMDRYRPASGYEKIAGYDAKHQYLNTVPLMIIPGSHAIIAEVNVDPKAESVSLDLQADPGKSVAIEVVGPDGAPIGGTKAKGVGETYLTSPIAIRN